MIVPSVSLIYLSPFEISILSLKPNAATAAEMFKPLDCSKGVLSALGSSAAPFLRYALKPSQPSIYPSGAICTTVKTGRVLSALAEIAAALRSSAGIVPAGVKSSAGIVNHSRKFSASSRPPLKMPVSAASVKASLLYSFSRFVTSSTIPAINIVMSALFFMLRAIKAPFSSAYAIAPTGIELLLLIAFLT